MTFFQTSARLAASCEKKVPSDILFGFGFGFYYTIIVGFAVLIDCEIETGGPIGEYPQEQKQRGEENCASPHRTPPEIQ